MLNKNMPFLLTKHLVNPLSRYTQDKTAYHSAKKFIYFCLYKHTSTIFEQMNYRGPFQWLDKNFKLEGNNFKNEAIL